MRKLGRRSFAALLALTVGLALTPISAAAQEREATPEIALRQIEVTILGMSCPFCAYGAEKKLKNLEGVEELEVVLETGLATLRLEEDADISNERLRETVKEAGFEVAKVTRNFESDYPDYEADKS